MAEDKFSPFPSKLESPAESAFDITPDDANDLQSVTRSIYVGTGGDISVVFKDGSTAILKNCNSGSVLPVRVSRVNLTNTTAADLVGLA